MVFVGVMRRPLAPTMMLRGGRMIGAGVRWCLWGRFCVFAADGWGTAVGERAARGIRMVFVGVMRRPPAPTIIVGGEGLCGRKKTC